MMSSPPDHEAGAARRECTATLSAAARLGSSRSFVAFRCHAGGLVSDVAPVRRLLSMARGWRAWPGRAAPVG